MLCATCGSDNPAVTKFCGNCGSELSNRCPACSADNPRGFKYCGECGFSLSRSSNGGRRALEEPEAYAREGERRHLTVLFSDLVNSTEIATRLDPEEWRELSADYRQVASEAVTRFGGYVAQYLGDGLVAYFGYPEAHDNDPEASIRAGLRIVDAVSALNRSSPAQTEHLELSVRVGIHAGAVVVGKGSDKGTDLFGETPNVAARVQAAAEPNSVVITAALHEMVSGLFTFQELGARQLKGVANPVQLYQVVGPTGIRGRLYAVAGRELTAFMGREEEMHLLLNRWHRVCGGEGQAALIVGEPGIGKSRLIHEFMICIKQMPHTWIEAACDQFSENTPLFAISQMLEQWLARQATDEHAERTRQLELSLNGAGLNLKEALPLMAEFLSLPQSEGFGAPLLAPEQKRRRLFATLAEWMFGAARQLPLVIALEDLHWADPSTLELIRILAEQNATLPLLLLCTARPEFRASWPMRSHHAQLTLNRLSDEQIRDMVQRVVASTAISQDTIEALVKRTTGVPLFVEELTRAVLDSRENEATPEIPVSLHDSLMARLDRLGPAKEVAQIGSVIGRQFSYQTLRALSPMPEEELQAALSRLCDAELLLVQGFPPDAAYTFKHALIQEAAYEALLKSRRRELHRKAAQAISEKFKDIATAQPELLARHWTAAGEIEAAIAAWTKAGDSARWRYAFKEAEEDYRQALAIVNTAPESSDRDAQELQLTSALLLALSVTKGYAAQETIEATTRARKLAESTGNFRRLFLAITGAGNAAVSAGDYRAAAELADRALDLAQGEGSPTSLAIAHRLQLETRFYRGDPVGAEQHFARGREFFADPRFKRGAGGFASSFGHAAFAAWAIGRADVALGRCREALANAREINSPFDQAFALIMEGVLQIQMREPEAAETAAGEAMALSDQHGFPQWGAIARIALGWARANTGRTSQGIALIREGLAAAMAIGARVCITIFLTSLAEAYALASALPEALETVEQALQANPEEIAFRPYAMTLRAELRFRSNQPEFAEADLREAVATARKMGAKSYELRAVTLLARWLASQAARDEARAMLRAIYDNFEQGFETRDLIEAKTLLDELADN